MDSTVIGSDAERQRAAGNQSVIEQAATWSGAGAPVVLATVVKTWKSAPQPVGSQMAIDQDGQFVGSVSGGCVEGAVIEASVEVLDSGRAQLLAFGVTNDEAWDVGLPCGGEIEVLLQRAEPSATERIAAEVRQRKPVATITDVTSGEARVVVPSEVEGLEESDRTAVERAFATEKARVVSSEDGRRFVVVFQPPPRLVMIGAVHLAQALAALALVSDFDVTVVDPRAMFATAARFPGVNVIVGWPTEVLDSLDLDGRTAVAALSHDPKVDLPALVAALSSECFFVGVLGSKRRQKTLRDSLNELGVNDSELEKLRGPIGLDIGARTTPEIAVSIMAQLVGQLRSRQDA